MFEIGNSLREARLRQGLDFPQIEQATKIRGRYLRALEDEQFDVLPAQTYVKGFLRSYAEYLGLDGQLYVDEYNSRYVSAEEEPVLRPRRLDTVGRESRRLEARGVVVALLVIGAVTAFVVAAWRSAPDDDAGLESLTPPPARQPAAPKPRPRPPLVLAAASTGRSFVEIHRGGQAGKVIYRGTLNRRQQLWFRQPRIWVRAWAPANLRVRVRGRLRPVPGRGAPRSFLLTPRGVTLARAAA